MRYQEFRRYNDEDLVIDYDLSEQVLRLELEDGFLPLDHGDGAQDEAILYPTLKDITGPGYECFVSASILALKAKCFDEALMATVEHLCEEDRPGFLSKPSLLNNLLSRLNDRYDPEEPDEALVDAMGFVWAAARLGGQELVAGRKVQAAGRRWSKPFTGNPESKPVGVYSETLELKHIYRRDRFLGRELPPAISKILAQGLEDDARLVRGYNTLLALASRLTNPLNDQCLPLNDADPTGRRFFPKAHAPESNLLKQISGNGSVADNQEMVARLIQQIREGTLDTSPNNESGWYDLMIHSYAPLLQPEAMAGSDKLRFGDRYCEYLEDLFASLLGLTRESRGKLLEMPMAVGMPLVIAPRLSLEPLPDFYLRRARTYAYVRELLLDIFGESLLMREQHRPNRNLSKQTMHPWSDKDTVPESPLSSLVELESLFAGAYYQTCAEIGHQAEGLSNSGRERLQDRLALRRWLRTWRQDPHLAGDQRGMVPLYWDASKGKMKALALLGFTQDRLHIDYEAKPGISVRRQDGSLYDLSNLVWSDQSVELVYPVTAEIYVDEVMDRESFRRLCDNHGNARDLLKALHDLYGAKA